MAELLSTVSEFKKQILEARSRHESGALKLKNDKFGGVSKNMFSRGDKWIRDNFDEENGSSNTHQDPFHFSALHEDFARDVTTFETMTKQMDSMDVDKELNPVTQKLAGKADNALENVANFLQGKKPKAGRKAMKRWIPWWGPVYAWLSTLFLVYYTVVMYGYRYFLFGDYQKGFTLSGFVVSFCVLALISHWRAARGDPGVVKREDVEGLSDAELNRRVERKSTGAYRYCKHCEMPKPDRSHYSPDVQQLVYRYEFYSAFVKNAVGHMNFKYFFLFRFYSLCLHLTVYIITLVEMPRDDDVPFLEDVSIFGLQFYLVSMLIVLVIQFGLQLGLATKNITRPEFYRVVGKLPGRLPREGQSQKTDDREATNQFMNKEASSMNDGTRKSVTELNMFSSPYDHGMLNNTKEVLGASITTWLLPTAPRLMAAGAAPMMGGSIPLSRPKQFEI